jgi:hypothetical protein
MPWLSPVSVRRRSVRLPTMPVTRAVAAPLPMRAHRMVMNPSMSSSPAFRQGLSFLLSFSDPGTSIQ